MGNSHFFIFLMRLQIAQSLRRAIWQYLSTIKMPTIPFDKIDFQGIRPAASINKTYSEIVPSVWNIWHGQKRPLLMVWEGSIYHTHTMDLLKSTGTRLSHSIWHSAQDNANCPSKHLFTFLMPFSAQGKSPRFLPYVFKWKVTLSKYARNLWAVPLPAS